MKKTIILVHGLRGTHHGLKAVASNLAYAGYKTILPDLPGSGTRPQLDNKSLQGYTEWLHLYIQGLNLSDKPIILGHSMGSIVVSHYLEKYPDDVANKVIFMSPIFRDKTAQKGNEVLYSIFNGSAHLLPKKARYNFLKSKAVSYCISHYLTIDKSQQKEIDELHYKYSGRFASADSLLADMKISMRQQTVVPPHKDILMIIGEKDRLAASKTVKQIADEHHAHLVQIKNTGHLINYEQPGQVSDAILEFLRHNQHAHLKLYSKFLPCA